MTADLVSDTSDPLEPAKPPVVSRFHVDRRASIAVVPIAFVLLWVLFLARGTSAGSAIDEPGEFVVNPRVDVMQALSMAGGTTPFAALNDIVILRREGNGTQQAIRFAYKDVEQGRSLEQNVLLRSGDVVVVP